MVAVTIKDLGEAIGRLDPESRALLDLSLRRGMRDDEIGDVLRVEADEVGRRRDEIFERLADDLDLDGRQERDELFATLPDLPADCWK